MDRTVTAAVPESRTPPRGLFSPAAPAGGPGRVELLCLPHAGAGGSAYRQWPERVGAGLAVTGVCPPGRESRFRDPAVHSVAGMMDDLLDPVADRLAGDYALFGHSMGALLAYELAQALNARGRPPRHLFVSGYRAPQLPLASHTVHLLSDEDLVAHLVALEGMPPAVIGRPDLVEVLLPVVRTDYEVCETYRHGHEVRLDVPVTALCGERDPGVGREHLDAWAEVTTGPFEAYVFDGGHFYLDDRLDDVVRIVRAGLAGPR